jgi:hypothetical protein
MCRLPVLAGRAPMQCNAVRFRQRNASSLSFPFLFFCTSLDLPTSPTPSNDFSHGRGREAHCGLFGTGFELYAPGRLRFYVLCTVDFMFEFRSGFRDFWFRVRSEAWTLEFLPFSLFSDLFFRWCFSASLRRLLFLSCELMVSLFLDTRLTDLGGAVTLSCYLVLAHACADHIGHLCRGPDFGGRVRCCAV